MFSKKFDIILYRLPLLSSGGSYPASQHNSLESVLYKRKQAVKSLKVLRNTGIIPFPDVKKQLDKFVDCKVGDVFGKSWDTHWFYIEIEVSPDNQDEMHLIWDSGSEAMIYSVEGHPLQGFTGQIGNDSRLSYIINKRPDNNGINSLGRVSYFIEMACCNLFGNFIEGNWHYGLNMEMTFTLAECDIGEFDREAYNLLMDYEIIKESADILDRDQHSRSYEAGFCAERIMNMCNPLERSTFEESQELASTFLSVKNSAALHQIFAIGHCHIDMAWLWPFSETRRKGGRSFSSQIENMKFNPQFKFTASSAGLYKWVKEDYPLLFADVQTYVENGQFIPVGSTWLEFDGNITGGESMARQFLYGTNFFKENFNGFKSTVFFLPDTFGYI